MALSKLTTSTSAPTSRKRRLPVRFGLRSIGILILLVAVVLGYSKQRIDAVESEKKALEELRETFVVFSCVYDFNFDTKLNKKIDGPKPNLESLSWFSRLFGKDYDSRVARISIEVDPSHLPTAEMLRPLTQLRSLSISGWEMESLDFLAHVPAIEHLDVFNGKGPTNIETLKQLHDLRTLKIQIVDNATPFDEVFSNKSRLESLSIYFLKNIAALAPLRNAPSLSDLTIANSQIENLKGIENLQQLTSLSLPSNDHLVEIRGIEAIPKLEHFSLFHTKNVNDLAPIGEITNLKTLNLTGSTVADSQFISKLQKLEELDLSLTHLDAGLVGLKDFPLLHTVRLNDSEGLLTLDSLNGCNLRGTEVLSNCKTLTSLRGLDASSIVKDLYCDGCVALQDISTIEQAKHLNKLNFAECTALKDISPLLKIDAATDINLTDCPAIKDFKALSGKSALQNFWLSNNSLIEELPLMESADSIKKIMVTDCPNLRTITGFHTMKGLNHLDLSGCRSLESLSGLTSMPLLRELNVAGCDAKLYLAALSEMPKLSDLSFSWGQVEDYYQDLPPLPTLRNLTIENYDGKVDLGFLSHLPNLMHLTLKNCKNLDQLACRTQPLRIPTLTIAGGDFKSFTPSPDFPVAEELVLRDCQKLHDVQPVGKFSVMKIKLLNCQAVEELSFSAHSQIWHLRVEECRSLKTVDLSMTLSLHTVEISHCLNLESVEGADNLENLRYISLYENPALRKISPLKDLQSFFGLGLQHCVGLKTLEVINCDVFTLVTAPLVDTAVERISFRDCDALAVLDHNGIPKSLKQIKISGSHNIPQQQIKQFKSIRPEVELIFTAAE